MIFRSSLQVTATLPGGSRKFLAVFCFCFHFFCLENSSSVGMDSVGNNVQYNQLKYPKCDRNYTLFHMV